MIVTLLLSFESSVVAMHAFSVNITNYRNKQTSDNSSENVLKHWQKSYETPETLMHGFALRVSFKFYTPMYHIICSGFVVVLLQNIE